MKKTALVKPVLVAIILFGFTAIASPRSAPNPPVKAAAPGVNPGPGGTIVAWGDDFDRDVGAYRNEPSARCRFS